MLHRMLGVVVSFFLASRVAVAADVAVGTPAPHSASSTLALFALGVALLGIALLRRRSDKPRIRKD